MAHTLESRPLHQRIAETFLGTIALDAEPLERLRRSFSRGGVPTV